MDSHLDATVCVDSLGITLQALGMPEDHICDLLPNPETTAPFRITHTSASATITCAATTLIFDITVDDPSNLVEYAEAEIENLADSDGLSTIPFNSSGPHDFSRPVVNYPVNTAELVRQLAGSNTIIWTAVAVAYSGQLITDGPHQLALTVPTCPVMPTLSVTLIPRLPNFLPTLLPARPLIAFPTNTPTATSTSGPSESTCPPGTYYAAGSNSCVKVLFTATSRPIRRCSQYNDASACTSNGCSWDKATSVCSK